MGRPTIARAPLSRLLLGLVCWLLLTSDPPERDVLEQARSLGVLKVASINGPLTVFEDADGLTGPEYDLVEGLARELGLRTAWTIYPSQREAREAVRLGNQHLLAAAWTAPANAPEGMRVSVPYRTAQQVVAYNAAHTGRIREVEALAGRSVIIPEGVQSAAFRQAAPRAQALLSAQGQDLLLERLTAGDVELVLVDTDALLIARRLAPLLRRGPAIGAPIDKVWGLPLQGGESLWRAANTHLRMSRVEGGLKRLVDRYFGTLDRLDAYSRDAFRERVNSRLPPFRQMFEQVAQTHGMDWRFLAAVAYQESAWNPDAISPTGVEGLMMLTRATAGELGVADRTDPWQSIDGGARYLLGLRARISADAQEPDRTWMSLAAYNMGLGHLRDLQQLTAQLGGESTRWIDLRDNLPKLMQPRWYSQLHHGYARGTEARDYVANIRTYYDLLRWMFPLEQDDAEMPVTAVAPTPTAAPVAPGIVLPGL